MFCFYPLLKTSESVSFSGIFKGFTIGTLAWNESITCNILLPTKHVPADNDMPESVAIVGLLTWIYDCFFGSMSNPN